MYELVAQLARMRPGAGGIDGWTPLELKALPGEAWVDREKVEVIIYESGKYPEILYQVPLVMLRKGLGLTPLQHRGISILCANYRLTAGVWWTRCCPLLCSWAHPNASGGLPGRECIEVPWDAQSDLEHAVLCRQELLQIKDSF